MELRQMHYFLVVAEEMHFRRAAERLNLSQPSLSQQIQHLEEELKVKLFERSNRSVRLTSAGERFLKKTRQVLRDAQEAIQETKDVADGMAGTFCIGYVTTALVGALPRVLRSFLSTVPGVDIEVEECDPEEQIQHILRETADIGFIHGVVSDPRIMSLVAQRDRLLVALPTELAPPGEVHLESFSHLATIMPVPFSSYGFSDHVRRAYELAGISPYKAVHVKLLLAGLYLVASGIGLSLVPACFQHVQVQGVSYRPLAVEPPPLELLAVWRRDSDSKLLKRFLAILRENCRGRSGEQ